MKYILVLLFTLISTAAYAAHQVGSVKLPNGWLLEKYNKDGGNDFSHCSIINAWKASSDYNRRKMRGDMLHFALKVFESKSMEFLLGGPEWKLKVGQEYKVTMRTSDGKVYTFTKVFAVDPEILSTTFTPPDSQWYSSMMGSESVELLVNDQSLGEFTLDGSRIAFSELLNCWSSNLDAQKFDPSFGGGK